MFFRKPLLPGRIEIAQLSKIFELCGTPNINFQGANGGWAEWPRNSPHWKDLCSAYDPELCNNQGMGMGTGMGNFNGQGTGMGMGMGGGGGNECIVMRSNLRNFLATCNEPKISETGMQLIESFLKLNPAERLTAGAAVTHEWFYDAPAVKPAAELNMNWKCESVHESEAKDAKAAKRQKRGAGSGGNSTGKPGSGSGGGNNSGRGGGSGSGSGGRQK